MRWFEVADAPPCMLQAWSARSPRPSPGDFPYSLCSVVWNPAAAKAQRMGDFGDEEWRDMVCVEVAQAGSGAVQVAAGGEWVATQQLTCSQ